MHKKEFGFKLEKVPLYTTTWDCPRSWDLKERDWSGQGEDRRHSQAFHTQILINIHSFLEHASFYHRFINDFSKIARPLTKLLAKDVPFIFDDEYLNDWEKLKMKLISAP